MEIGADGEVRQDGFEDGPFYSLQGAFGFVEGGARGVVRGVEGSGGGGGVGGGARQGGKIQFCLGGVPWDEFLFGVDFSCEGVGAFDHNHCVEAVGEGGT